MAPKFKSVLERRGTLSLPDPNGTRIMMMPIVLGDIKSVPDEYKQWHEALTALFDTAKQHNGLVGYLTIDEKRVDAGATHRRAGLHVDGVFVPEDVRQAIRKEVADEIAAATRPLPPSVMGSGIFSGGGWGGSNSGSNSGGWGAPGTGMLTVASHVGCRAWNQEFEGSPGYDGECDHLKPQCRPENEVVFGAGEVFWLDGLCVHESIPQPTPVFRQFLRLSMPSCAPWFEGYTVNPLGVLPTGPVLPRRVFMDM